MTTLQMSTLNADILRNLGTIAEDEGKLKRAARYLRRLANEMTDDPTLMTEEEFFRRVDEAKKGPSYKMLPGEDLTTFLNRVGNDL